MCPFWNDGDFAVHDVRYVGIIQGDTVPVVRGGEGRVEGAEGVDGFRIIAMLPVVDRALLRGLRVVLQEERCPGVSVMCGEPRPRMTSGGRE